MAAGKSYLLCVFALLLAVVARAGDEPSAGVADKTDTHREIDPKYFLGSNKYYFFDDYLSMRFEVTKRRNVGLLSGILLQIDANNGSQKILLVDWDEQSDFVEILVVNGKQIDKYKISGFVWPGDSVALPVGITLYFRRNIADLEIAGRRVAIPNLDLSVNTGYKFSLLPALSQRPDPNIPPVLDVTELTITSTRQPEQKTVWYWLAAVILIDLAVYFAMRLRKRRRVARLATAPAAAPASPSDGFAVPELPKIRAIRLFGGFYVYSDQGEDITKQFSPMLRELLSLVVIHSAGSGISSTQLKEILWPDKDLKSARNNRAVYIGKLRAILDRVGAYTLSNDTAYWKFESSDIFVDYLEYKRLAWSPVPRQDEIERLIGIVQHGNLMPDADYGWLDACKAEVADAVIERLCSYADTLQVEQAPELAIALADTVSRFDHLNERALCLKCRAYYSTGRHASAKTAYDLFAQKYREIYDSNFRYDFTDVLNRKIDEA